MSGCISSPHLLRVLSENHIPRIDDAVRPRSGWRRGHQRPSQTQIRSCPSLPTGNIGLDDGLILPHSANPTGSNFRERQLLFCLRRLSDLSNISYNGPQCYNIFHDERGTGRKLPQYKGSWTGQSARYSSQPTSYHGLKFPLCTSVVVSDVISHDANLIYSSGMIPTCSTKILGCGHYVFYVAINFGCSIPLQDTLGFVPAVLTANPKRADRDRESADTRAR
jgi:hypothetical protein